MKVYFTVFKGLKCRELSYACLSSATNNIAPKAQGDYNECTSVFPC